MRISIFDQTNHNIVVFEGGRNSLTAVTKKYSTTLQGLISLFTNEDRSIKNRLRKCTDHGVGHWYYTGVKDKDSRSIKHVIVFMNDARSHAVVFYRAGSKLTETKCSVSTSVSKGNKVWNMHTDNEIVEMNVLDITNSVANKIVTLEEALARIAELEAEVRAKDQLIAEIIAQREEAVENAHKADKIRAGHFVEAQKQKNIRQNIEREIGQKSVEERLEELDNFEIPTEEELNEELEAETVEQKTEAVIETEIPFITRSKLTELYIYNTDKHNAAWDLIDAGKLKLIEE
ncbi:hypothetical protein F3H77_22180 [Enterobacter hormaechei]|uniref:hypothetical protein n=1 Tax=Enterobacter hormaechei TaxID=158836 RepID=UPI00188278F6|nr:hypothetical protein [Enterobacter hormaechei]MBE8821381.1 hypothetical protein [Enterobacter hormaechei]MBE8836773.1 hypothetical protein [Enterobacter hormaechei]MBE8961573.1 hypothetical protein [Enterobacter hormaechei]